MHPTTQDSEVIAYDDLAAINAVAMMRLPLRAAEAERLARMRQLLDAASDLSKALSAHTHCALVNCRGTYGAGSLDVEAEALARALREYAMLVRKVAADYRRYLE